MRKGISIWSFPSQPLADSFRLAKAAGFEGVEVALDENAGEINLTTSEKQLLEVKRQAEDAGLSLYSVACALYWNYWLSSPVKAEREKAQDILKCQLDTAATLGCQSILVIPGCVNAEFAAPGRIEDYEQTYQFSRESLEAVKDYAKACQVEIALENVWNKFLLSPMEMRDFIDTFQSPWVGSYLDIGNMLVYGYPEQWVRILGQRIKKVHFKDYRVDAGGLYGFVDLLAGDVNFPAVMAALKEVGYDGWVTAEMTQYKHYNEALIYNTSNAMDKILGR